MNDEFDVVACEKSIKVLHVTFKNSGKSAKIYLTDGTDKADKTGLRSDCPSIMIETDDHSIYLDAPNIRDFL